MENQNREMTPGEEFASRLSEDLFGAPVPPGYEPRHANLPLNPNVPYQSTGYQSLIQQVEQPIAYVPNPYTEQQGQQPGTSSHEITEEPETQHVPSSVAETQLEGGEEGGESPK